MTGSDIRPQAMTPPAGPEEVREPDFEAALLEKWRVGYIDANTALLLPGGSFACEFPELIADAHNALARAYVALQARVEEAQRIGEVRAAQSIASYIEQCGWKAELQMVFDACMQIVCEGGVATEALTKEIHELKAALALSHLAKLEQERGRGEG